MVSLCAERPFGLVGLPLDGRLLAGAPDAADAPESSTELMVSLCAERRP